MRASSFASRADWKVSRFFRTVSRLSHSVKPGLRARSPELSTLAPPVLVLKPCTSHGSFLKGASSRICMPRTLRSDQGEVIFGWETGRGAGLPGRRRVREALAALGINLV